MFLLILLVSMISLVVMIVASFYFLSASSSNWVSDMWSHMGGMMGASNTTVQNPAASYLMVMVVVLIGVVVISGGGLVYFLIFPEIKTGDHTKNLTHVNAQNSQAYDAILKTLTNEERKVIQVLKTHKGKYLQKYIRKEAELSRLKTHRILARLADRDIVTLRKTGNTNEVQLSEWLEN